MRRALVIVLAAGVLFSALGSVESLRAQDDASSSLVDPVVVERRPMLDRIEQLRDDLVVVDEHLAGRGTAAHDAVDRMRHELRALRRTLRDAPSGAPAGAAGGAAERVPLSADDFAALRDSVDSATFEKPQVDIVTQAVRHGWFTSEQAEGIVREGFNAEAQIAMAVLLYPRVVDRQRFFRVVDVLTMEPARERLRAALKEIDERE